MGEYISSFVGTFPVDNPKYVILVVVDRPTSGNYCGRVVATLNAEKSINNEELAN